MGFSEHRYHLELNWWQSVGTLNECLNCKSTLPPSPIRCKIMGVKHHKKINSKETKNIRLVSTCSTGPGFSARKHRRQFCLTQM